jgi:tyrosine-protein kinase Etk/Wzc
MAYVPSSTAIGNAPNDSPGDALSFSDLLENLLFYWWAFLLVVVLAVSVSVAYAIVSQPWYQADVLIEVEPQKGSALGALTDVEGLLQSSRSAVQGEIEILRSRAVIGSAIAAIGADTQVRVLGRLPLVGEFLARRLARDESGLVAPLLPALNVPWGGEQLTVTELTLPPEMLGKRLVVEAVSSSEWALFDSTGVEILRGRVGERREAFKGSMTLRVTQLRARPRTRFELVKQPPPTAIREVAKRLVVREATRGSNVIRASLEDRDPDRAIALCNAIAQAYLARNVGRRSEEAQKSLEFLRAQLPLLKQQLEASERRLNDFRNAQRILDVSAEIGALLERAVAIESKRAELEIKRRELALQYESAHPALRAIDAQLFAVRAEADRTTRDVRELPSREQEFLRLSRDVQVNTQLYVSLLNNAQQLEIARAGTIGNVAIIDRAIPSSGPSRPNKQRTVALGGLAGVLLGFLAAQLLAALAGVVRDPRQLESALGLEVMAIVPRSPEQHDHDPSSGDHFLVAERFGGSATAEALRSLRTAVLFSLDSGGAGGRNTILVTSATPAQGKSFVSANLAFLLASGGKRVLIIDADIRRRSLREYFPISSSARGLSDLLAGSADFDGVVIKDAHPGLSILPAGPQVRNPGDLFSKPTLERVIHEASSRYDYVVIDSAPIVLVNDAAAVAKYVAKVLFVARQNEVTRHEISEAVSLLRRAGCDSPGVVFNGFVPSKIKYGYGARYGYGYGYKYGYGARYGDRYGEPRQ